MWAGKRPAWFEDGRRDLRYAVRTLVRAPGFTLAAVLTLALGIGSVTVIYSVVHNVLLDPLPYPDSRQFVNVIVRDIETGRARQGLSPSEFLDFKEQSTVFDAAVGTAGEPLMYDTGASMEILRGVLVTPDFFEFMGLAPLIGRVTTVEDARPDAPPVAVLRHRAWVTYFNADPGIVGRTIRLNGAPRTVVGVMPARFTWHAADLWIPKPVERTDPVVPGAFRAFQARLKAGVTLEEAEAQLNVIAQARAREHPKDYPTRFQIRVVNVIDFVVGGFSGVLYTTLAAVALLMLIACCNVTNMLLGRATAREREMTVRAALGAGTGRIIRQLLVEGLLLSLCGAAVGCLLAYVGIDALVSLLPPNPLPGEIEIALDGPTLAFSLGIAAVAALFFGLAPALYGARRDLVDGLKSSGKGIAGGRGGLRNALVTAEIALSLVLLLGAGLLVRSFINLVRVDPGFNPAHVVVTQVSFAPGDYTNPVDKHRFYESVLEGVASLPGVEAAAATTSIPPFAGGMTTELEISGRPQRSRSTVNVQLCTEDYFRTVGVRLVGGRGLSEIAVGEVARTAVVNQTFAAVYFAGEDPLGKQFRLVSSAGTLESAIAGSLEIVGVAPDVRNRGIRDAPVPQVYLPGAITGRGTPVILVRTAADPSNSINAIRREIGIVDRRVAVRQPTPLREILQRSVYAEPRFSLIVLGVFAVTATLLVAIGVFSVMAYTVSRQTREIAVRMALGAGRHHVFGMILRLGAQLLVAGVAAGAVASAAGTRLIANQLWNTSPHDPLTFAVAMAVITLVAFAACYIPARRAMSVDPMTALRQD